MFAHLHTHTQYSLLDGASHIDALIEQAVAYDMEALAITDHGVMYGVLDFYQKARDAGIRPILGCEVYVAQRTRFDREVGKDDNPYHLILLAENQKGYANLMRIVSLAYTEGLYYKPRCDRELLERYHEGIIALSGCIGGEIPQRYLSGDVDGARSAARWYRDTFGPDHFFFEIQDHGLDEEQRVNEFLRSLGDEMDVGLVATNDVHYTTQGDAQYHDVLLCIQTGRSIDDEKRMRFPADTFYFRSHDEMVERFQDYPGAIENTHRIASRCQVEFDLSELHLPRFEIPAGYDGPNDYLEHLCREGLAKRYDTITSPLEERLEHELRVIDAMGYASYFLIVWDFIRFAREADISVGPGRGSAASSLVAYSLGITNIDPIEYNLVFERFLNPERISMPDIDIDFCYERRDEVIDYVVEKYGEESVAQIITFGTMAARAVLRDVGRAMSIPYDEVDQIAKMVPSQIGITLEEALDFSGELRRRYQADDQVRNLVDTARFLEGMPRHASVHAAGVVIANGMLMDYVPLQRMGDGSVVTQFSMGALEDLGLLKMDFLGLRTLTVIEESVKLIRATTNEAFNIEAIPMDDPTTFQLIAQGETEGVFQLESEGMRDLLRELVPTGFEDIIAAVALYRPGPMENIPTFVHNKHNPEDVEYLHPDLEPILKDTYGIIVYQEQVMQVASVMAGFSLGQADILRRAMGKKKADVIESVKHQFIEGCRANGHERDLAVKLFSFIEKFANYGFNRGHTAPYALLAYQTAYLKANYPLAFMAALLTSIMGDSDKVKKYVDECRRMGIEIVPPDINKSMMNFTVDDDRILFGLAAVKNVGRPAIEAVVSERETNGGFFSLWDFCERVDHKRLNRRATESLIQAGAFDSLEPNRGHLLARCDSVLSSAHRSQRQRMSGQMSLFELGASAIPNGSFGESHETKEAPLTAEEKLALEKDVLGVYLSGHPLDQWRPLLEEEITATASQVHEMSEETSVVVGGLLVDQSRILTRKKETMAFLTLEDWTGRIELVVFPGVFESAADKLHAEEVLVVSGCVSHRGEQVNVRAESFWVPGEAGKVFIELPAIEEDPELLEQLKYVLCHHKGDAPVYLCLPDDDRVVRAGPRFNVTPDERFKEAVERLVGNQRCRIVTGIDRSETFLSR